VFCLPFEASGDEKAVEEAQVILSGRRFKSKDPVKSREQRTVDGIVFDSKLEVDVYLGFKSLQQQGQIERLQYHPKFRFEIKGIHVGDYEADFTFIERRTQKLNVIDVKAWRVNKRTGEREPILDPTDKWKKGLMLVCFGLEVQYL
jgi:hypothetical protein